MVYAICCTARSGSSYLCSLLGGTGQLGFPDEYANNAVLDPDSFDHREYFESIITTYSTPNGIFGIKLTPETHAKFSQYATPSHYIFLRRHNIDEQAISYYRAAVTGTWGLPHDAPAPRQDFEFDYARIVDFREFVKWSNQEWLTTFAERGITAHEIWYEDLLAAPEQVVKSIAEYLEVPLIAPVSLDTPNRIMRDRLTQDWLARLHDLDRQNDLKVH